MEYVAIPLVFAALMGIGYLSSQMDRANQQVARRLVTLERRQLLILEHLGITEPEPDGMDGVRELLAQGRKLAAIKQYRVITGVGLAEARDAVEQL